MIKEKQELNLCILFFIQGDKGEHGEKVRGGGNFKSNVDNEITECLIIFHLQGEVGPQGPAGPQVR